MVVLLTNDDGIQALGLRALYRALLGAGIEVVVVAPLTEQSAVGHAVTIFSPLRSKQIKEDGFQGIGISGTPVDCVKWALNFYFQEKKPDLVISGINNGANVGIDILYSGTVSAATEGALANIPSLAVSIDDFRPADLEQEARWVSRFIFEVDWPALPKRTVLNLNFPGIGVEKSKGLKICPHTDVIYEDRYEKRLDPRGREYFWLTGVIPLKKVRPDTDRYLLSQGYITLTPLQLDLTNYQLLRDKDKWFKNK
ncbi:MAG TPA: 5'/3'-nucleotidase SurE [Desulfonauticus sp.]|jgi:5'-nucleotidase|nr:MAG: 5'-nucleotidase SurE [Desulfonauticus sp. 38_4375]MDK2921876.1 5/3-nucleotidase [Desulfonauticus sp.]HCO11942.1 5'/3'-nucleotidase SurE [Desulfonauticus sp.]